MSAMHETQKKILALLETKGQLFLKYAQIGRDINEKHIQNVKYHLSRLEKRGYIVIDKTKKLITKAKKSTSDSLSNFSSIPYYGEANCGSPLAYAEDLQQGVIKVSESIVSNSSDLITVKASGNSMNQASIAGEAIEDGDYVVVDTKRKNPQNKDYVLSVIDDGANIKRIYFDDTNHYVVLRSESIEDHYRDIIIHRGDNYSLVGTVKLVIKKPQIGE